MTTTTTPTIEDITKFRRTLVTLQERLPDLIKAVDALATLVSQEATTEPQKPAWPDTDVILVTSLSERYDHLLLPVYAVRDEAGDYLLTDGTVLWQEDHEITAWEPLHRLDEVLSYADLSALPDGAQVHDRNGITWEHDSSGLWHLIPGDEPEWPTSLSLLRDHGPLALIHNQRRDHQ